MDAPVEAPTLRLEAEVAPRVNFASAQNAAPILRRLVVANPGPEPAEGLELVLTAQPPFARAKRWAIDRVGAEGEVAIADRALALDLGFLAGLNEAERGELTLALRRGEETLAEIAAPVELLARDEWGGLDDMARTLAAFVMPNDAGVARILKEASRLLARGGHADGLEGYQSGDPRRVWMIAAAIWSAVTALGLSYANPPASFERRGQKVRSPGRVASEGLATCLDLTLLFCAALEAAGLNAAAIFTRGHAFAGVWLVERTFDAVVEPDVTELRKAQAAHEFVAFETTLATHRPAPDFGRAIDEARARLSEAREDEFERAVDLARARAAGLRPLASHEAPEGAQAEEEPAAPAPLPEPPDFGLLPGEAGEAAPTTPEGRIGRWQRKLLDLSLRNRLLNFSDTKQTLPILCGDLAALEDRLAEGASFRVISLTDEDPVGERDPALFRQQTGEDIHDAFVAKAFERRELCAPLPGAEMAGRLVTLHRKAKSDLAEGGANTLFLAVGFLRWKKSPEDKRVYRAPLLLVPARLDRRSAQASFRLSHHEDEVRVNATLLQFLERDFGLRVPALAGELPTDGAGLDLPRIFAAMRAAVRDAPGFEVAEEAALSTFSFAKHLMWKDLVDRTEQLRENRLVRHLIDSPETPFAEGAPAMPEPRDIDRRLAPADLLTPLPADSSQLAAVVAAAEGRDFVVIGPPGTGKSQTIANMIAHCLGQGKTVLFVAEKAAALDVVHRRLKAHGLAEATLELHSNKTDRKAVIGQLGAAWDRAAGATEAEWVRVTADLRVKRDELNAYVEALHAPGTQGRSVFEAIGATLDRDAAFALSFPNRDAHDAESLRELEALAEQAGRAFEAVRGCEALRAIGARDWSFGWQDELFRRAESLGAAAAALLERAAALEPLIGLAPDPALAPARRALLARFAETAARAAAGDFRAAVDAGFDGFAPALERLEAAAARVRAERGRLSARYADAELARMPLDDLDRDWREACARIWPFSWFAKRRVRKLLQSYAEAGAADPAADIAPLRGLRETLPEIAASPVAALPGFQGERTDPARLRAWLSEAGALRAALVELQGAATDAAAMAAAAAALLQPGGGRLPAAEAARAFTDAAAAFDAARAALAAHAGGAPTGAVGEAAAWSGALEAEKERVRDWTRWASHRERAVARGLGPLIEALERGEVEDAAAEFRAAYFAWWLPLAIDASPALRGFLHWEQADRVAAFRALDEAAQGLAASQVVRAVAHGLPARDGVPRKSELGTLRHQLGLQRPSVSIRSLVEAMPTSFTKLAPCVLMSPLSIAQYLPAGQAAFDIVIFDEASQITTWDAVGAIARGRQSIIVGDPKQLPPTHFFGRADDDAEAEIAEHEQDLPSILDEAAAGGLPRHQLNWHYRSRDEALIAFSNHHYYGDRLVTFPSPRTESEALRLHRVEGVYARGAGRVNQIEAKALVALAAGRLREWLTLPEGERPTLGVITFNVQQQELILDLLDAERRKTPELEWFFDDAREEPVIVKNLENIQGDERDVMLFSVTFGPDLAGKVTMNFGALNGEGGEKRLNVAVTRARSELHVFSSLGPDQIDLSRTRARGVADLKTFLAYAERGAAALPAREEGSLGPAESPFETAVAEALRDRGWEVRTQIGVSGFRIDLGVVHPGRAGAYLAGVECDGATYHRSATARDRDKVREAVLRNLGWEILRVWSTDWFMNPREALDRLDAGLDALLEAERASRAGEDEVAAPDGADPEAQATPAAPPRAEDAAAGAEAPGSAEALGKEERPGGAEAPEAGEAEPDEAEPAEARRYARGVSDAPGAERAPAPDADRFFEDDYAPALSAIISVLVAREGPLRLDALVREVARLHGWKRAGRRIRERVLACLPPNEARAEGEAEFVWAPGARTDRLPFRPGLDRSPRETPEAEILWLIDSHPGLAASEDPAADLARLMGVGRVTADARARLEEVLRRSGVGGAA